MNPNEEKIYNLIEQNDVITIWGHGLPDGDCYGSQIGLRELIRNTFPHKKVYAIGSGIPSLYARIATMDNVDLRTIKKSLAILVDSSCLRRIEDERVTQAHQFAKFDHHMSNPDEEFFGEAYVDATRVSCSEIIAEFGFNHKMVFTKRAAEALYIGIVTDSGRFRFYGTGKETFEDVAKLFEFGVEPKSLFDIIFAEDPTTAKFRQFLLKRASFDGKVAYVFLKPEDYLHQGLTYEHASSMVNALMELDYPIYCLFTIDEKGDVRGELRSKRGYPVQPTASKFGGGGHLYAAGLSLHQQEPSFHEVIADLNKVEYQPEGN